MQNRFCYFNFNIYYTAVTMVVNDNKKATIDDDYIICIIL